VLVTAVNGGGKRSEGHVAFDRRAGGHAFDFDREVCVKCGMSREHYQDNGKPPCKGKPSSENAERGIMVRDD
jgi:hypothetical protein